MTVRPRKQRAFARLFAPWRVGPVFVALLLLFIGAVAVVNAAARPIEVSLNSGDPWEFDTSGDLQTAGTPIFVATGGVGFTARVTIDVGSDGPDAWTSTSYQFLTGAADGVTTTGAVTCINHANVAVDGSFFDFALTAPATAGVYGIRFIAYNTTDNCTSGDPRTVDVLTSVNVGGENPEADPGCGFSMGLIVDSSGSIDDGGQADEDAVKAAVIALLTQLEGTGVEVSLIDFDTNATVIFQPTVASATLTADTLANWNYNADGFTNWEDALLTQRTDLNDYNSGPEGEPSSVPDFVLFFTDGAPTVRIGATGGVTDSDGLNLTLAVVEANLLKAAGARMLGIGVGGVTDDVANINRLKAVTGPVQSVGTPDPLTDDLIITDFDDLTTGFQELALSLCGESLTITKEVPNGQGGWEPAPGWEFTVDVAMSSGGANDYEWELPDPGATAGDPVTESTNANGTITYQWQPDNPPTGADVSVEETIQTGYEMVSVDCQETRLDGDDYDVTVNNLDLDAGTFDIELTSGSIGTCTVRNQPEPDEPELTLDKTSTTANYDSVGDVINYEYELTNTGNVPLTPPYAVTDDKATVTCPQVPNPLNPGASITCTASYIVTQADLNNGEVTNTAQGSAEFEGDPIESNEDEETVPAVQEPELTLDKTSTTANYDSVGDVINYEYELTNTGNVPLEPPYAVTDDKATVTCPQVPDPLDPGDSITCTASYIVTQADLNNGEVTNTAQGSAEFDGDPITSNEDEETVPAVQSPSLSLDKSSTTLNYDSVGDVINYEYELTNSGNVPLSPPYAVTDDKTTVTCPQVPDPLDPGDSITCTASYIVTQADITAGSVTNTAQGSAEFDGDPVNSNEDDETVPAVQGPSLSLDKSSTTLNYDSVGDVINYEYELTNSGNVPLEPPYAVTDDKTTVTCPQVPDPLDPGDSITCTASYIVTQADLNNGEVTNTAQGSAEYDGDPVNSNEDNETVPAIQEPELTLDKTSTTANFDSVGDVINYEYELTNTGNVALFPTYSVDDDKATVTCPQVPDPLDPGASITCTASYIVTAGDIINGSVTNTAQGRAFHNDSPVNSNEDEVTVPGVPVGGNCDAEAASNQWTDILGIGMGNSSKHKNIAKVVIPNAANVLSLYGQMAAKDPGNIKYVRFMYPNGTFVQESTPVSPAPITYGILWYGSELEPANNIRGRWFLQKFGTKNHVPRALVLYPTYEDEDNRYVNVFQTLDTSDTQVYWEVLNGWTQSQQVVIEIPAPLAPSTFNVELALVDNDNDVRPIYVTVTAGGVSQMQQPIAPNRGDLLNLLQFTLVNVPAGTDEIVIDITSPSPYTNELGALGGDSGAVIGVTANYLCVDGGD